MVRSSEIQHYPAGISGQLKRDPTVPFLPVHSSKENKNLLMSTVCLFKEIDEQLAMLIVWSK